MTDNLPAVRTEREIVQADTDSWVQQMGPIVNLSNHIAETEFVPKALRNKPAAVAAALLYGREVGLPPMTALAQTHVIEGKPAMSAEAMRAMILAAGHDLVTEETTGAVCRMRARRRNTDTWTTITWNLDMARAAGLIGKQVWKSYPRAMLQARCTAELARLVFPDVLHGFRAIEELDDGDDSPGGGAAGLSTTGGAGSTVQRKPRKSTGTKGEATLEAPRERPALSGPPLPGEAGYEDPAGSTPVAGEGSGEPVESAPNTGDGSPDTPDPSPAEPPVGAETAEEEPRTQEEEAPPPRPVSKAQLRMLHASFNDKGWSGDEHRDDRLALVSRIIARPIESTAHMTVAEASGVIDTLAKSPSIEALVELLDELDQEAGA